MVGQLAMWLLAGVGGGCPGGSMRRAFVVWVGWGLQTRSGQSWRCGVFDSCVGSSEGFPEVWMLGWRGRAGEEEGWTSSGLRSGPLGLPLNQKHSCV